MTRAVPAASLLVLIFAGAAGRPAAAPQGTTSRDPRPDVVLPAESAGWDRVLGGLLSAFEKVDVVELGEAHSRQVDSELRIRLIRHPDFPNRARFILVEFGDARYQPLLDRYVNGADVREAELQQVRGTGVYAELIDTVRDVNRSLAPGRRLRVLSAGQPGASTRQRNDRAVSVLREQVLSHKEKALVIFGAGHVWHSEGGLTTGLQQAIPGRVFVAETLAPTSNGQIGRAYRELDDALQSFEGTLNSTERPVLVSLRGSPAARLIANPFYLGQAMLDPDVTLGDLDDAVVYFGRTIEAGALAR